MAKTVGGMVTKAVGIFRGEGCLDLLFYFCLWEEVLAQGDLSWPVVWNVGTQSNRRAGVLGPDACGTTMVLGSWGTGALAGLMALMSKVWLYVEPCETRV